MSIPEAIRRAALFPAFTVGAGAMSRPIPERLGFTIVGWAGCLLDDLQDRRAGDPA